MNIYKRVPISLVAAVFVWMASFALYLATLAPSLTWGINEIGVDGGELLAAASTLGIPHPPGYPTYTLLLKFFATIVPIGDFAYRGNLMSAVMASTSSMLIYLLAFRLSLRLLPDTHRLMKIMSAVLATLVYATTPLLWSQATITEVYTLNAVFIGLLMLIAFSITLRDSAEVGIPRFSTKLALFGLLFGLGMGNHLTLLIVTVPVLVWLGFTIGWKRLASPWLVGAFVLGLSIYLYLPIRAAQNPPINWGGATSIEGVLWMVTGRAYQGYFGVPIATLPERLVGWVHLLFIQFNPFGLFLGIVGARFTMNRVRGFFLASLVTVLLMLVYSIQFNSVDSEVLIVPILFLFSIWVGVGFLAIVSSIENWVRTLSESKGSMRLPIVRFAAPYLTMLFILIAFGSLPAASVALNYESLDLSSDNTARGYASEVLGSIPDDSVIFSSLEGRVFSLWYLRFVEETDRDIVPIAVPLLQFDWYLKNIRNRFPDRVPSDISTDYAQAIRRIAEHNQPDSRVFFTYKDAFLDESFNMERVGNIFEATPKHDLLIEEGQSRLIGPTD